MRVAFTVLAIIPLSTLLLVNDQRKTKLGLSMDYSRFDIHKVGIRFPNIVFFDLKAAFKSGSFVTAFIKVYPNLQQQRISFPTAVTVERPRSICSLGCLHSFSNL